MPTATSPSDTFTTTAPDVLANAIIGKLYNVLTNGDATVPKSTDDFFSRCTPGIPVTAEDFRFLAQGLSGVVTPQAAANLVSAVNGTSGATSGAATSSSGAASGATTSTASGNGGSGGGFPRVVAASTTAATGNPTSTSGAATVTSGTGATSSPAKGTDISILAFICKKLPRCPNPDPSLTWS